ncbi:MAG: hypothetical protein JST80_12020 [Bdellovibrionales bacterium]|nr:hypothetical protein [Bdellovibrionales bacterium]
MTALKKIALFVAFFAFVAGPTAFGSTVSHCAESDLSARHSSIGYCQDDHVQPASKSDSVPSEHVHCNPVACHFTLSTQVTIEALQSIAIIEVNAGHDLVSVHLESIPRPPAA